MSSDSTKVLQIIADNLGGTLEHTTAYDSAGNEWKKYTIVYDYKNKKDLDKQS